MPARSQAFDLGPVALALDAALRFCAFGTLVARRGMGFTAAWRIRLGEPLARIGAVALLLAVTAAR